MYIINVLTLMESVYVCGGGVVVCLCVCVIVCVGGGVRGCMLVRLFGCVCMCIDACAYACV